MPVHQTVLCAIGIAALLTSGGCASIVSGRHANVQLDSYPSNAHVVVHDKRGREVASITTPGVVSLKRTDRYFLPARYTATFASPGYATVEVPIRSGVNPWILGNVVVGGVPGLIVDSATGATWKPKNEEICQHLEPLYAATPPPAYQPGTGAIAGAAPAITPSAPAAAPPAMNAAYHTAANPAGGAGNVLPSAY